ncbi:MAG: IS110 family transposase [Chloroflexi bacterium]|nr:IS110 family transposase [Chloroflexota bacterium]
MKKHGEAFVGIDTAKLRNAVAVAEGGREGEVRYLGEFENTPQGVAKLIRKLADRYETLHICYEAGPTGYGLYRQVLAMGHECMVVAPSLIPRRPGDRVKTNRRDAQTLARLLRAGELTAVWVPDPTHEAVRDLVRTRMMAVEDYRRKRQHVTGFLLRHGRTYTGKTSWKGHHLRWLDGQNFDHPAQRLAFQEMLNAVRAVRDRLDRLEAALLEIVPSWTMAPVVAAFQAMRGVQFLTAATMVAEAGDLRRFDHPRQLMAFLGLVPSERSTGETRRQGGITKAGNSSARRVLVEAAWTYRHSAGLGVDHQRRQQGLPEQVRDIAWKAQARLCARYRRLMAKGKRNTVAVTAVAREMAAFLWAIARHVDPLPLETPQLARAAT